MRNILIFTLLLISETLEAQIQTTSIQKYPAVPTNSEYLFLRSSETAPIRNQLTSLEPLILPENEDRIGLNWHLGWPVATAVKDELIVAFHRKGSHHRTSLPNSLRKEGCPCSD